jgi:hypothetical protein
VLCGFVLGDFSKRRGLTADQLIQTFIDFLLAATGEETWSVTHLHKIYIGFSDFKDQLKMYVLDDKLYEGAAAVNGGAGGR